MRRSAARAENHTIPRLQLDAVCVRRREDCIHKRTQTSLNKTDQSFRQISTGTVTQRTCGFIHINQSLAARVSHLIAEDISALQWTNHGMAMLRDSSVNHFVSLS